MKNFLKRAEYVLHGEEASSFLEAAIVITLVCIAGAYLLRLLNVVIGFGITRNGWTSSTGWFRSSDTAGIMNPD